MATADLTAHRLRQLLDYNPDTGAFTWRVSVGRKSAFSSAGYIHNNGYVMIRVDGIKRLAHSLAWLYQTSAHPCGVIDHVDGNKANNAFANLRDVSMSENQQNQSKSQRNSSSGFLGVAPIRNKWRAQLVVDGRQKYLGMFDTPEEAHQSYLCAKRLLHKGCTI